MMLGKMVVTGAAAFVCAALIGLNPRPASAQSNPPLRALAAKGNSFDGFFQHGTTCDYCDGPSCGCFLADSNGGTGTLKFDGRAAVSMAWNLELDYANDDQFDNATYGACWPASGMLNTYTGPKQRQVVTYTTSGFMCNTYFFNQTYTGSYYIQAGNAGYSTTFGSGALSLSILSDYNAPVLDSQLQLTGNISRSTQTP
ncbi:MAG TPA: hypothetical protein VMU41_05765 [Candidatus Binataceae bacterium]|nr:hypothetical protein [Candidatus Binataceae bacterium]